MGSMEDRMLEAAIEAHLVETRKHTPPSVIRTIYSPVDPITLHGSKPASWPEAEVESFGCYGRLYVRPVQRSADR